MGPVRACFSRSLGTESSEQILVAVANHNSCSRYIATHRDLGSQPGVTPDPLSAGQSACSSGGTITPIFCFAQELVDYRGKVSDATIPHLREIGWTDEQIVETVAQVALNLFTNYINIALDVPVDFPEVDFQP